VTKV
jgi:hypothetical protein